MKFNVPQGQSKVSHFDVYPDTPDQAGQAVEWMVMDTTKNRPTKVNAFDINFSRKSSPQQRQSERMIMVFTIAETAQSTGYSWRFVHGGVMYCEGKADYKDDLSFQMSSDGMVLTATAKALSDGDEDFQFSFLAMCRDNTSGECHVFASKDPGGKIVRN